MIKGLYCITDRLLSVKRNPDVVRDMLEGGCRIIQYREKDLVKRKILSTAKEIRKIISGYENAIFIMNDNVDVALAVDADGVHLGQTDMPIKEARRLLGDKIIGVTVHDVEEAKIAEAEGADYLGVSPIFATVTKSDAGAPGGLKLIKDVRGATKLPLAAIGGIDFEKIPEVMNAGADAVCVISAILKKEIKTEVRRYVERISPKNKYFQL